MTLAAQGASRYSVAALLTRPPRKTCSLRFHILSCFSIPGGLSTVYGLTLAAQGASRYSVAALLTRPPRYDLFATLPFLYSIFCTRSGLSTVYGLTLAAQGASRYSVAVLLTRPPRKTCSLRFRIEFALRLYHSTRVVARKYQKNIAAFAKFSDNRIKFVAFSIRSCYNSSRTWGYSSVGRALASHVRGQGFDSPYLHQDSKTAASHVSQGARDCASTQFVSRRPLTAIAVRRLPLCKIVSIKICNGIVNLHKSVLLLHSGSCEFYGGYAIINRRIVSVCGGKIIFFRRCSKSIHKLQGCKGEYL